MPSPFGMESTGGGREGKMHVEVNERRSDEWSDPKPAERPGAAEGDTGFPTPGKVFGEIGATLAVFLVIALAANLLVTSLGG